MILNIIVLAILLATIGFYIWLTVSIKNIPNINRGNVKRVKQNMSKVNLIDSFNNRKKIILEIDNQEILKKINEIQNDISINKNYDINMGYSQLNSIDKLIKQHIEEDNYND